MLFRWAPALRPGGHPLRAALQRVMPSTQRRVVPVLLGTEPVDVVDVGCELRTALAVLNPRASIPITLQDPEPTLLPVLGETLAPAAVLPASRHRTPPDATRRPAQCAGRHELPEDSARFTTNRGIPLRWLVHASRRRGQGAPIFPSALTRTRQETATPPGITPRAVDIAAFSLRGQDLEGSDPVHHPSGKLGTLTLASVDQAGIEPARAGSTAHPEYQLLARGPGGSRTPTSGVMKPTLAPSPGPLRGPCFPVRVHVLTIRLTV